MKAISLWQPWASLLVQGVKQVETRGWNMRHRGPLLIHAAKTWNLQLAALCAVDLFEYYLESQCGFVVPHGGRDKPCDMPFGAIIGSVEIRGCWPTEQVTVTDDANAKDHPFGHVRPAMPALFINQIEKEFGDYSPGRFASLCVNATRFATPIPFRGAQGLFEVSAETIAKLGAA